MQLKEPNRIRVAGVVLRDNELLLMFRRKDGREYYTFPGGGVEEGESSEEAVVREIQEETTISVDVGELLYELHRDDEKVRGAFSPHEFFYRCTYKSGTPILSLDSIEEKIQDREKNYFEPMWVKLSDIGDIPLLPPEIAEQFFHDFKP